MPLVALVPQWRQDYPNKRTHRPEAMTAEMGQRTHAPQKRPLGSITKPAASLDVARSHVSSALIGFR
jgi:hypothetical protein